MVFFFKTQYKNLLFDKFMIQINQIPYIQGLFRSVAKFSKMWIMCNFFALTLASFWRFRKIKIVYNTECWFCVWKLNREKSDNLITDNITEFTVSIYHLNVAVQQMYFFKKSLLIYWMSSNKDGAFWTLVIIYVKTTKRKRCRTKSRDK